MRAFLANFAAEQQSSAGTESVFAGETNLMKVKYNNQSTLELLQGLEKGAVNLQIYGALRCALQESAVAKSVCAKTIRAGDTVVECLNCQMDHTCIICLDCYKNSNHDNHRVVFKKGGGGCCDCGDVEAWKKEGFCLKHSGETLEVDLDANLAESLTAIFEDLFYLYFRLALKKEKSSRKANLPLVLLGTLSELNSKGPQYNKFLSLLLQRTLPQSHLVSKWINSRSILHNLLTYRLVMNEMKQLNNLLISMFPYYGFKKSLLVTYVKAFNQIYDSMSDEAANYGSSITCQLLTSYALVDDYIRIEGSIPIGHNFQTQTGGQEKYAMLFHDLNTITKLSDGVNYRYWKFHLTTDPSCLFLFYEHHKKKYLVVKKKKPNESPNFFMIINAKTSQIEFSLLELFSKVLPIISHDKPLLLGLIQFLYRCAAAETEETMMIIFKPYQRVLAMSLFIYFDYDLGNIVSRHYRDHLLVTLGVAEEQFLLSLDRMLRRAFETYFFFNHIVTAQANGLSSSFYFYLYFYQIRSKLMQAVDAVWLKTLILLSRNDPVITFEQILFLGNNPLSKANPILCLLKELGLLYVGRVMDIFLADKLKVKAEHLENNKLEFVGKYMTKEGGCVGYNEMIEFGKSFMSDCEESIKSSLKPYCEFRKDKKQFLLKTEYKDDIAINLKDFRTGIVPSKEDLPPLHTAQFVTGELLIVFRKIWTEETLKKLINILQVLAREHELMPTNYTALSNDLAKLGIMLEQFGVTPATSRLLIDFIRAELVVSQQIRSNLQPSYINILGEQIKCEQDPETVELARKKTLQQRKQKKKSELIMKNKRNMATFKLPQDTMAEQTVYCVICRKSEDAERFVYLSKMSIRNHEKMLHLGTGVQTLSFTSCYHVFHLECVQTCLESSYLQSSYKCPVCRNMGNTFLPVDSKSTLFDSAVDRISQVMHSFKDLRSVNIFEELLKSFYHYALLSKLDLQGTIKRRRVIYRSIVDILSRPPLRKEMKKIHRYLLKNAMNLIPEVPKEGNVKLDLKFVDGIELQDVGELMEDEEFQDDSNWSQDDFGEFQINADEESPGFGLIDSLLNLRASKEGRKDRRNKRRQSNLQQGQETTPIFKFVLGSILAHIFKKSDDELQQPLAVDIPSPVVAAIADLLNCKHIEAANDNSTEQSLFQFRELPRRYYFDQSVMFCDYCKGSSPTMMLCLLCSWNGCLNCQAGGVYRHTKQEHGEVSAYMERQKSAGFVLTSTENNLVGYLYKDEWGDSFSVNKPWDNYELDREVLLNINKKVLMD